MGRLLVTMLGLTATLSLLDVSFDNGGAVLASAGLVLVFFMLASAIPESRSGRRRGNGRTERIERR